jgi:hypothetical protein
MVDGEQRLAAKDYTIDVLNPIFCPEINVTLPINAFRPVANLFSGGQAPSSKQSNGHACNAQDRKRPRRVRWQRTMKLKQKCGLEERG